MIPLNMNYKHFLAQNIKGVILHKILIVDDSTLFRKTLQEGLHARFPSLVISEAKDGEEALRTIPIFLPDLIFMDIQLPNGNGLELTRFIKGLYPTIKVIILTSYDLPEYRDAVPNIRLIIVSKDLFMSLVNFILAEGLVVELYL
jgi:DNA-binding NarL/FixJ family response regulator